jgi:hypothetical protein
MVFGVVPIDAWSGAKWCLEWCQLAFGVVLNGV